MELRNSEFGHNSIIGRDFNTILNQKEKRGRSTIHDTFQEDMEDLILALNLLDIKPVRFRYTRNNKRPGPGHIAAHLNRFLASDNFFAMNLSLHSFILP